MHSPTHLVYDKIFFEHIPSVDMLTSLVDLSLCCTLFTLFNPMLILSANVQLSPLLLFLLYEYTLEPIYYIMVLLLHEYTT